MSILIFRQRFRVPICSWKNTISSHPDGDPGLIPLSIIFGTCAIMLQIMGLRYLNVAWYSATEALVARE